MLDKFLQLLERGALPLNLMMAGLGFQAYQVGDWFMGLPDPSPTQSAFVTAFYTLALPAAFKFYIERSKQ